MGRQATVAPTLVMGTGGGKKGRERESDEYHYAFFDDYNDDID